MRSSSSWGRVSNRDNMAAEGEKGWVMNRILVAAAETRSLLWRVSLFLEPPVLLFKLGNGEKDGLHLKPSDHMAKHLCIARTLITQLGSTPVY